MMGQREDVAASLMRGDSRDGCARRKVADQVKAVVYGDGDPTTIHAVADAASAVVLASDLRAPAETRQAFIDRLTEDLKAERAKVTSVWPSDLQPSTPGQDALQACEDGARVSPGRQKATAERDDGEPSDEPSTFEAVKAIYREAGRDVLRREGWRARLANVERLLCEVDRGFTPGVSAPTWNRATAALIEAVTEIRAMIDGEGE